MGLDDDRARSDAPRPRRARVSRSRPHSDRRRVMASMPWQSGQLPGRENRIVLGPDYEHGIERLGIRWVHVTDDGPEAKPGERWWCEYFDRRGNVQAAMASSLLALVRLVRDEEE